MSIDAIKQELASLDQAGRKEIVAYLVALDDEVNAEYRTALAQKIDDKTPGRWMTLEELDRRLSGKDDETKK